MNHVVLVSRDDPRTCIKQVPVHVLKMFHYFNNYHIIIPMCVLNQDLLQCISLYTRCQFGPEPFQ